MEHDRYQLIAAVYNNDLDLTKLLIESGADVKAKGLYGETPLHVAFTVHNYEIAKLLIKSGADVNAGNSVNETSLHCAAGHPNVEVVKALISVGANVNAKNIFNDTPLHIAAGLGNVEILKALISAGANVNAKGSYEEHTPLDFEKVKMVVKKLRFLAIKEELMAAAWHPDRVARWAESGEGVLEMMFGC